MAIIAQMAIIAICENNAWWIMKPTWHNKIVPGYFYSSVVDTVIKIATSWGILIR